MPEFQSRFPIDLLHKSIWFRDRMGHGDHFDLERTYPEAAAQFNYVHRHLILQPDLVQLAAQQGGRERRRPDRALQPGPQILHRAEMILVDERAGLERRVMRFIIEGDNRRGANNAGVVIPAGVAHALRAESSEDVIMVYGTSTSFNPAFEGRIESGLETAQLPPEWEKYIMNG